jgi:hypothetical protein
MLPLPCSRFRIIDERRIAFRKLIYMRRSLARTEARKQRHRGSIFDSETRS